MRHKDPIRSARGRKLWNALMQELHRRDVIPVQHWHRAAMRISVAMKLGAESMGDLSGLDSWAKRAADSIVGPRNPGGPSETQI